VLDNRNELQAAEVLLARAIRDRDEAAQAVRYLSALVARYSSGAISNGHSGDEGAESGADDKGDHITVEGYGGMKRAVHALMVKESKGLRMSEIATLVLLARFKDNQKAAMYSARTAVRALMNADPPQVKKHGPRYKAV